MIFEERVELYEKVDKKMSSYLKRIFSRFEKEFVFKASTDLIDIKDSLHISLPKNCVLKQVAIRKKNGNLDGKYIINKDLWDNLSPRDRAGLLLHEYLYRYFSELGQRNSRKVRKLNAWIMAHDFKEEGIKNKYIQLIRDLELPHYP